MADDQTPSEGLTGSLFDRIKGFLHPCGQRSGRRHRMY